MATRKDCINAAVRAGATADEAVGIVDMIFAEAKALQAAGKGAGLERQVAGRIMEAAEADKILSYQERKQAALTIRRRAEVETSITRMMADGASFSDAMSALLVGASGRFAGARESVSSRRMGLRGKIYGGMSRELEEMPGAAQALKKDRLFSDTVHAEMLDPGSTGDMQARHVAEILGRYLEDMRVQLNDAGANIGKLENYAPQSHSSERMLKGSGREAWIRFVDERLDWERSFPNVTDAAARADLLSEVFDNITTGQNRRVSNREAGRFSGPRNMGRSLSQERVLHFKDGAASLEYHQNYGQGTILQAVIGQLDRYASRASLMEVFGPNPESMIQGLIAGRSKTIRTASFDEVRGMARGKADKKLTVLEKRIESARKNGNETEALRLGKEWENSVQRLRGDLSRQVEKLWTGHRDGRIGTYFAVLAGETGTPVNPTVARISANVRGVQSMAKLGAAFLSAFADVFIKAVNLRHNGENLLDAWKGALDIRLQSMQSKERLEFGRMLGMYSNTLIGDLQMRFDAPDAPSGAMTRAMNGFFKLSGLEAWTEGHKASYAMTLSGMLGRAGKAGFSAVNKDFAVTLKRHGLDTRWNLIRKMARQEADGEWHVLPERAYALTDADIERHLPEYAREGNRPGPGAGPERLEQWERARAKEQDKIRRDTATKVMGFYADETRYAVLEPDEKTRAWMYGNTKTGTARGEFWRFMLQFKSFPVSYMQRIMFENRWLKAGAERSLDDIPGMIHFAVSGMAFGYLAMSAKDISKGREPRDVNNWETWIAAALQSGGLGIMGDFFLGTKDRFGSQAAGTILGPIPSQVSRMLPIFGQMARGEMRDAGEDALRFALDNTPGINLWYTRAALDYLFLYHVREMLSPGTLARSERKLKEEYNQTYLNIGGLDLTPSKVVKRGGGFK